MADKNANRTNALRKLDAAKIAYKEYDYTASSAISGVEVAEALGLPAAIVFKTLVTTGKSGKHYVFMLPAAEELDLKKAAEAAGEKYIEMLKSKELLPLTGYIHGGCSPIGMKKSFPTFIHESAGLHTSICCSGGRIGLQIELSPEALSRLIPLQYADLIK